MKKIFIHAYMAGNLGDDLLVWILCKRYPQIHFRLLADISYKERFKELSNVTIYSPGDSKVLWWNNFFNKYFHKTDGFRKLWIKTSDASVHIGGSVFTQHDDDWSSFYLADASLLSLSKKLFVIGANFGPYTDRNYYLTYKELFRNYSGICIVAQLSRQKSKIFIMN